MKKYLVLLAVVMGFSSAAHAGLYLEPYVGYGIGKIKGDVNITAPITAVAQVDDDAKGLAYGGKVGFSMMTFALGADYMGINFSGDDDDTKGSNIGAFAQFTIPMMAKLSATYFFSSKADYGDNTELEGSGIKAGVGLTMLPVVSINIDYFSFKYDKVTVPGLTISSGELTASGFMVGVSVPLDL